MLDMFDSEFLAKIIICFINAAPTQIVYLFTLTKIFNTNHKVLYWALNSIVICIVVFLKAAELQAIVFVVGLIGCVVLPLILLKGVFLRKLIVLLFACVVMSVIDYPTIIFWTAFAGEPWMDFESIINNSTVYCGAIIFHLVLLSVAMWFYYMICKLVFEPHSSQKEERLSGLRDYVFSLIIATQLFFIGVEYLIFYSYWELSMDESKMLLITALLVAYFIVDLVLFQTVNQYSKASLLNIRASILSQQVDRYLSDARAMQSNLRTIAVLRHDLRNHLQVVSNLCERGKRVEAIAYLNEFRDTYHAEK